MSDLGVRDWLTIVLALYGAVLSTILAIKSLRKDRRRLQVSCSAALVPSSTGDINKVLALTVANVGHRPVVIEMAALSLSNSQDFHQKTNLLALPKRLADGESATFHFDFDILRSALNEAGPEVEVTHAWVRDQTGRHTRVTLPDGLRQLVTSDRGANGETGTTVEQLYETAPEELRKLVDEVGDAFGRPIPTRLDTKGKLAANHFAALCLDADDLHILYRDDEHLLYQLAHEYFHLKRFVDGIPFIDRCSDWWTKRVDNPLEHIAIYPHLARLDLGVDPYEREKTPWSPVVGERRYRDFPHNAACSCWRMLLCTRDPGYQTSSLAELERMNPVAAKMGSKIADQLRPLSLETPEDKVEAIRIVRNITKKRDVIRLHTMQPIRGSSGPWYKVVPYDTIEESQ